MSVKSTTELLKANVIGGLNISELINSQKRVIEKAR